MTWKYALAVVLGLLMSSGSHAEFTFLTVNELLPDPNGADEFDTDRDGKAETEDEFIEFYNQSGTAVDISGYELWVGSGGTLSKRYEFPASTTIDDGGFIVVVVNWNPGAPPVGMLSMGGNGGVFGNGGDNFVIYDPASNTYASYIYNDDDDLLGNGLPAGAKQRGETIDLGSDSDGLSISRHVDGAVGIWVNQTPTPRATNVPEPAGLALAVLGMAAMAAICKRC